MFIKPFKLFTVLLGHGKAVRKFIFAVVSLYKCYTIILTRFLYKFFKLQYTQAFLINHYYGELKMTAFLKRNLSWSFSIIATKNNQQLFLNLLFWTPSIHIYRLKLSQLLANSFVLGKIFIGNAKRLKWIWCFMIVDCWPEDKHFHKSPQMIIICVT